MKKALQRLTPKFYYPFKYFKQRPFKLLDVGSGNHSPSKTKNLFPKCEYHGVDLKKDFNNDESDFQAMHSFYEMDLTQIHFDSIPDNYFDFIRMAHVIEHLFNGDKVLESLIPKLKKGGYIYIEYPGPKSTRLPSMKGSLNFYDDHTHVRLYSIPELERILKHYKFKILDSGTRRNPLFIAATPFRAMAPLLMGKKPMGNVFWDMLGFAEFVIAKKE